MAKVGMKGSKEGERKIKFKKKVPKKVKTQESIEQLKSQYGEINSKTVKSFQDLPLSKETLAGLKAGKWLEDVWPVKPYHHSIYFRGVTPRECVIYDH